jgi:2-hydroxychromene-2-carboxylate isomerase
VSLSADIDSAALTVCLDLRHPLAYLALQPAIELERALGVKVNWLPLTVPTLNAPTVAGPDDDRAIRHRRNRAQAIAREIAIYADVQGLVLLEPYRSGPADAANCGWLWMRDRHADRLEDYLVELFRSYWALEIDADDDHTIAKLIDRSGGDGASFLGWSKQEGQAVSEALVAVLQDRGFFGVPAYVLEDEVFYGRQHLPMVRWILEGRSGPVPI